MLGAARVQHVRGRLSREASAPSSRASTSAPSRSSAALEPDIERLSPADRARYAYLRGMTDFRIGYKAEARHWLALAAASEKQTPGALPADWAKRMTEALKELNEAVYTGGIASLSNTPTSDERGRRGRRATTTRRPPPRSQRRRPVVAPSRRRRLAAVLAQAERVELVLRGEPSLLELRAPARAPAGSCVAAPVELVDLLVERCGGGARARGRRGSSCGP